MPNEVQIPELLAPAGGPRSLRAAVANGADAVYLGLDRLNARRGAENFTLDTLSSACEFAHLRDCRVYLTANVVLLPSEIDGALELVSGAWSAGIDAVIVQDIGFLAALRSSLPQVRVHSSTQMNVHSSDTLRVLAEKGVSRVTLARETSVPQIAALCAAGRTVGVEVESFVHGALCVCYSGQCLLSSLIGGRSANRGMCAQPCRLTYDLLGESEQVLETPGAHLLSPKDLAGISVLPQLIESGVAALKIEGRMKSPDYVALVTGVYRAALDRAAAEADSFTVRQGEVAVLSEAFSRGFTEAYLTSERGNDMMSYRRPNNRGVPVGRVASMQGSAVATIAFDAPVDSADIIEVWTSRGRFAQQAGPFAYSGREHATVAAGQRASIRVDEPVGSGDRVFRVQNAALSAAAQRTYADADGPPIPLTFRVSMTLDRPLHVRVEDASGRSGQAQGPVVERARTKAVTAEEVAEHVGRLGNTPYEAASWDIEISHDVGIGFSALHKVRREALADYERTVLSPWSRRTAARVRPPALPEGRHPGEPVRLVACVASVAAASACLAAGADEVQIPADRLGLAALNRLLADSETQQGRIVPVLPRVRHDDSALALEPGQTPKVVAGTLGDLAVFSAGEGAAEAHWSLNALNAYAVAELASMGATLVWASPELAHDQLRAVLAHAAVPLGVGVAGRQELMVTEHCILMAEGPCDQRCEGCSRRAQTRWLKDRKGYRFPVVTDLLGRSHLYNSVPLDLVQALPQLLEDGIAAVRVDLEVESPQSAAEEVARVRAALAEAQAGRTPAKRGDASTTSGHYFRGVS